MIGARTLEAARKADTAPNPTIHPTVSSPLHTSNGETPDNVSNGNPIETPAPRIRMAALDQNARHRPRMAWFTGAASQASPLSVSRPALPAKHDWFPPSHGCPPEPAISSAAPAAPAAVATKSVSNVCQPYHCLWTGFCFGTRTAAPSPGGVIVAVTAEIVPVTAGAPVVAVVAVVSRRLAMIAISSLPPRHDRAGDSSHGRTISRQ